MPAFFARGNLEQFSNVKRWSLSRVPKNGITGKFTLRTAKVCRLAMGHPDAIMRHSGGTNEANHTLGLSVAGWKDTLKAQVLLPASQYYGAID
jgi:hypothetical protein